MLIKVDKGEVKPVKWFHLVFLGVYMKKIAIGYCTLLIFLFAICSVAGAASNGILSGRWITKDMGPMTGAQVLLFNASNGPAPSSNKFLRIPDAGVAVDSEGKFSAEVPAGKYYLVMRKRINPDSAGPPDDGDPQYYARLKNGSPKTYLIKAGKTTDVGTITIAVPYSREKTVAIAGMTGIKGAVTDEQSQPVSGIRVFAYASPRMLGRPLFASDETGADGKYFLNVVGKGNYYLKARTHYGGGKPADGEFLGAYGKPGIPEAVDVETGKIREGIDFHIKRLIRKDSRQ